MSLTLPPRPSLDYLRKQAKARLDQMQATSPATQLAAAQHALARDYGFSSWARLKAHVQAVQQPPAAPPVAPAADVSGSFGRYTHRARQALFFSRWEAAQQATRQSNPNISWWG